MQPRPFARAQLVRRRYALAVAVLGLIIALSLVLGLVAWAFFVWTVRSGQYDDPEGPKYRMLDDEDPPPPEIRGQPRAPSTPTARGGRP